MHGAAVLAVLVLAAWPQAAAQDAAGLEVGLRPVSTSLEAGKAYLIGFTVRYPCGPSRTIFLEAAGPEWAESAVPPNFPTRSDKCLEGFHGEYSESVLVDVHQDAVEGTPGDLTLRATDGDTTATQTVSLKVRQTTPRTDVAPLAMPLVVGAGETVNFNLTTTYTMWKQGRIRWIVDAPAGWRVAVPPTRATEAGEDRAVASTFAATAPLDANGTVLLSVHSVLANQTGARVAESAVTSVLVHATPLPAPDEEPVAGAGDVASETPRTVPPRPPVWIVGSVILVAMVGIYALESREERRK